MTLKVLIKYIIYFSPGPIKKYLKKKADKHRLDQGLARYKRCKVSKKEVEAVLSEIDLDCDVMLHTSTINIGRIEGGVKWLAKTIVDKCDLENHTLIVSALPYFGSFSDYISDGMAFDVSSAPIAMGEINERIAAMEGAYRSAHPTHSVVAIGKDKEYYAAAHHLDSTPFGPNSPYYKLLERRAHVLLFGATFNNITFIHAVEDALGENYPVKNIYAPKRYTVNCITQTTEKVEVSTPVHDKFTSICRDLSFLEADGLKHGYIKRYPLGEGYVYDIDALALAERYCNLLKEGKSIYGKCRKMSPDVAINFKN